MLSQEDKDFVRELYDLVHAEGQHWGPDDQRVYTDLFIAKMNSDAIKSLSGSVAILGAALDKLVDVVEGCCNPEPPEVPEVPEPPSTD